MIPSMPCRSMDTSSWFNSSSGVLRSVVLHQRWTLMRPASLWYFHESFLLMCVYFCLFQLITTYEVANLEKRALQNIAWRYLIIDEAHRRAWETNTPHLTNDSDSIYTLLTRCTFPGGLPFSSSSVRGKPPPLTRFCWKGIRTFSLRRWMR